MKVTLQLVVVVRNAHTAQILPPYTEIHMQGNEEISAINTTFS